MFSKDRNSGTLAMWDQLSFMMITGTMYCSYYTSRPHNHSSLPARHQAVPPLRAARGGAASGDHQRPVRPDGLYDRQDALLVSLSASKSMHLRMDCRAVRCYGCGRFRGFAHDKYNEERKCKMTKS